MAGGEEKRRPLTRRAGAPPLQCSPCTPAWLRASRPAAARGEGPKSRRLRLAHIELKVQRLQHRQDRLERRIAFGAERLVQRLALDAGLALQIGQPASASDDADRVGDVMRVAAGERITDKVDLIFVGLKEGRRV